MQWIGPRLGRLERACMRSVLGCGHALHLWHYGTLEGVPDGVVCRDAAEVIPATRVFRHAQTGSYALFSNLFRYTLLARGAGVWLDADVYLLRPVQASDGYVLGWEAPGVVATAVLGLPPDSPVLSELIGYFDGRRVPPWLPLRWRIQFALGRIRHGRYPVERTPWGYLGPQALTYMVGRHGLEHRVQRQDVYSPFRHDEAQWIRQPGIGPELRCTEHTCAIHLFNQMLVNEPFSGDTAGTFLERLHREGA